MSTYLDMKTRPAAPAPVAARRPASSGMRGLAHRVGDVFATTFHIVFGGRTSGRPARRRSARAGF
jgi:hypothetical protein